MRQWQSSTMRAGAGVLAFFLLCTLTAAGEGLRLTVTNPEQFERNGEILSLNWSDLEFQHPPTTSSALVVLALPEKAMLPIQMTEEALLVQIDLGPGQSREILIQTAGARPERLEPRVDGRFVLPRQDYAWENERIAYRVYGPALAGEVRNGIDVWTKRVRDLIVAKWYQESEGSPPGKDTYHVDRGEGADFFSVGKSLGAGASGLWFGGRLHQPGVFSSWRTIENGPLRVQFELTYDSIRLGDGVYRERCRITLDAGSNLNRIDVTYGTDRASGDVAVACGLVKRPGVAVQASVSEGWIGLWGPTTPDTTNGYLGTGVVFSPAVSATVQEDSVHHILLGTTVSGTPFTYYAGAGWTRSGDFRTEKEWTEYLSRFSRAIRSPVRVTIAGLKD